MEASIRFVVEVTIHEGKLEAVKQLTPSIIETVEAKDSGALSYEYFISENSMP